MARKKSKQPEGEQEEKDYRLPLRFKDFDKPIIDALEQCAKDNRQSINAAAISLIEEALRGRGYLAEKPTRTQT